MPLQIQRQYASSLDADYEFATLEELKEYATTSALSYSGQVLYCKANDTLYKVNAAKTAVEAIGEGGGGGTNTYTTLAELGLTADATFQDVVDTLPEGGSALLGVTEFTNYQTIFPYEEGNDQFARVHMVKGAADGSRMYARWFRKDGVKEAIAIFNIDDNKFGGWRLLDNQQIYTSLTELGLTEPVSVGEVFNAMVDNTMAMIACEDITVHVTDVPMSYGILTIKKKNNSRFSIEYQNSLGGSATNVKRWIGTLKGTDGSDLYWKEIQTEIGVVITSDTITKYGTEILKYPVGTWRIDSVNIGKQFTDLPYTEMAGIIEIDSIQPNRSPYEHVYGYRNYTFRDALTNTVYTRSLNSGNTIGTIQRDSGWCTTGSHFYKLSQMYLTTNATIQEVIDALPIGSTAVLRTDEFTDWSNLFNGIQWGYLKVEKTVNGLSNIELQEVVKPNRRYFGTQSSGKFSKWVDVSTQKTYTELVQLELTADATVDDVLSTLQPGETFTAGVTQFTNYQTLFPYDSSNDQYSRVFIQQGTSQATAYVKWFRKDGSREALANLDSSNKVRGWNEHTMNEIIHTSLTESLAGITTTLDLINALITEYRAKNKPVRFISGSITKTQLTDLPSNYGLLDITVAGYDLVEARFAQSEFGFKKMFYGLLNRASSETLFSSLSWGEVNTGTTLVTNTSTLKLDVTKKNAAYYGAIKLTYLYDTSPVEVEIDFRSATDTLKWTIVNGQKYIKSITYTQDSNNTAHYTIGIEFSSTTYGCYQAEVIGGFADINSLTKDAFTGDTTAIYGNPYGKNNGVTLVTIPEDLGLTSPCTTVQLVQAMRNTFNKTITSGAIGVFNNGGSTITDAPSDYGLLHIETFGHDRIMIRYDGIGGSTYAGSWIGQIKGSNGTFSGITWAKIGTDNSIPGRYVADISGSAITIKMTRHNPAKQGIMKIQYNKWITTATYDTRTIELSINPNFPRYTGSHPDEITSVTYNWSGSTATDCSICISVSGSFNPYVIVDMDPTYATINSVTNASTALAYTANPMQVSSSTSKTFSNSDVLAADTEIILQPGSGTSLSSSGYEIKNGICYFVVNIQTSSGGTYKPSTTYKVVQLPVPLRYPVAADINGRIYTEISDNKAWVEGDGILRVVMTHTAATYHNLYVSGSYPVK